MLKILYRDSYFVAINKPSGLLVHRSPWCPGEPAALELLRAQLGRFVYPAHRIDRATSGVLLFALDSAAAAEISDHFREHRVRKSYLAVARGYVEPAGRFDDPLKQHNGKEDQEAVTDYVREAAVELRCPVGPHETSRYSLVRLAPKTGRYHQVRRHLAHASHPIVGDRKHGDRDHNRFFQEYFDISRLLLMATDFTFEHPYSGRTVRIHAPLPPDINRLFGRLGWPTEQIDSPPRIYALPSPFQTHYPRRSQIES